MPLSFRLCRLLGADIYVHWALVLFFAVEMFQHPQLLQAAYLAILFLTVLIHEFGHSLAARHFGLSGDKILLWPFGGIAFTGGVRTTWQSFWVVLFGPAVHLPLAAASAYYLSTQGVTFAVGHDLLDPVGMKLPEVTTWTTVGAAIVFKVQAWLFALNVFLPAYPLDGGRMLVALLLRPLGSQKASFVCMMTTAVSGLYLLSLNDYFLGSFFLIQATALLQHYREGTTNSNADFVYVPSAATPASPARPRPSHLSVVPKTNSNNTGNVTRNDILTRTCPLCGQQLGATARMCGFCEIFV